MEAVVLIFLVWRGVAGGMKFVILRSGSLSFEGHKGGFRSILVFSAACFREGNEVCEEAAAKAFVSCFSLVFLSSPN